MTQETKMHHDVNIPNIPWEDRPWDCNDIVWRYSRNPIIRRDLIPYSNSIFNSAVVPFNGNFAGVFRCDNTAREVRIHAGFSDNGIDWKINHAPIKFVGTQDKDLPAFEYAYDPRVCWIEDRYWVTWCNGLAGEPTIGVAWTQDFEKFYQEENAFLPHNRNGVLFPRKINESFFMLSRPSDNNHTPFGDIYISQSPDMTYWGKHRLVMKATTGWQSLKIGAGPIPIETDEGWLMIYHGVLRSCNGYVYSFGAALLDIDQPWKVIARNKNYLLSPQKDYECLGDVPNVVFPCSTLYDKASGRMAIYYGGADTVVCMAFAKIKELIEFIKHP